MKEEKFVGVVLGGDMNSYAVARAFYEEYKIKTILIGKRPLYPTQYSKLIEPYYNENIMDDNVLIESLKNINEKYPNKIKILFGNTDFYVKHIINNKKDILNISDTFIVPIVDVKLYDKLFQKASFYELCDKYGINHPKTKILDLEKGDIDKFKIPFEYPIFMKPSDTVLYSKYDFDGKQKGYKINNHDEFIKKIKQVKESGYNKEFIIQEYINGNDDTMFVYTAYVSKDNEVQAFTGGKILMHDRTPELIGNYNAITNAYDKELCMQLKEFLESIKFYGICHFDVQYDTLRKKYYVFEMNIRQGRSNYYTLASGVNLAKYIVDDYIYNKKKELYIANKEFTASVVPKWMLKKIINKNNKIVNFSRFTLANYDMNIMRLIYQLKSDSIVYKNYLKYNKNV